MADMQGTLLDLSEEFTCSICLGTFESPVTTPCGHNFCRFCLELTWGSSVESWSCPQCRTTFTAKPELRKNTVLDTVVQQYLLQQTRANEESEPEEEVEESCPPGTVPCDSCPRAAAAKTCLTCMASFCEEHLKPHLESQAFAHHQLQSPLGASEMKLRTCGQHSKLLEYFCLEHGKCLCCYCVVEHKACKTDLVAEAKRKKEGMLMSLHTTLDGKIGRVNSAFDEVTSHEFKVQDTIQRKKELLKEEFSEINSIIQLEEQKALKKIEEEEKQVKTKFSFTQNVLHKKKKEFDNLKDKVETLLKEDDDIIFLMKAAKLNDTLSKDAYVPRIDCDQKLLHAIYRGVYALKEMLRNQISQSDRPPDESLGPKEPNPFPPGNKGPPVERRRDESLGLKEPNPFPPGNKGPPFERRREHSADPLRTPTSKKISQPVQPDWRKKPGQRDPEPKKEPEPDPEDRLGDKRRPRKKGKGNTNNPPTSSSTENNFRSREDLLKYSEKLSLDFNTAHKRIVLTEKNTKISVSDNPQTYSENPQRFTHCSQVMGYQGFARGIHYWEIEIKSSNFCGIGVSYRSIDRRGTDSRLGRNKVSWCIEWFNAKLSAWHNDDEVVLQNPSPEKVGVLLNCDEGQVIFFSHVPKTILLYKFQAQFTEAVYPAFWVFSSNTTLALCPLK